MKMGTILDYCPMKITGRSTREMFDRYHTIDEQDTKRAVGQLRSFLKDVDQSSEDFDIQSSK